MPAGYPAEPYQVAIESYRRAFPDVELQLLEAHLALASVSTAFALGVERRVQACGFELTRPRYTLLRMLYLSPDQRLAQNRIAQALGVSGAYVTQLVDALELDGWVERVPDPSDRRITHARLTEAGRERCSTLVPAVLDYMLDSCSALTPDERDQLLALLSRVREHLAAIDADTE